MAQETSFEESFESAVKVGHAVPDFEFDAYADDDIRKIHIGDYKDRWLVLFFYPADFTFVCPTELEELADAYDHFKKLDTAIVSMSADTAFAHKAWHDSSPAIGKILFPMGSDPSGRISRAFGVRIEGQGLKRTEDEGLALRGTFLIDPEGVLRVMEIHDNSIGRSAKELLRKLQAAQFVREHGGSVCPAGWNPGDETLTPGMDLVGKI